MEHEVITIKDVEMKAATKVIAERMKLIIEYAAGAAAAAVLYRSDMLVKLLKKNSACKVGVILCGGNAEIE